VRWRVWRSPNGAETQHGDLAQLDRGAVDVAGQAAQAPGPIAYLLVDDLPATLDAVERAGGRVLVRSLPFAGGGEIGLFADPDGNVLGLWQRKTGGDAGKPAAGKPAAAKAPKPPKPAAAKPKKK